MSERGGSRRIGGGDGDGDRDGDGDGDGGEGLTRGDGLRYGFLVFLASLLFLGIFGRNSTGLLSLLALYLLVAVAGLLIWARRKGRL